MNAILSTNRLREVTAYAELQREIHHALLMQHPEWIELDGNSPKCDEYDRRFAELLALPDIRARKRASVLVML